MTAKKTPLYQCHKNLACFMTEFAGTTLPVRYGSEKEEHLAVRRDVGMFDISHMGEFFVEGSQAHPFLQSMLSNNLDRLAINQAQYTLLLNEQGGIIDDLIVYRLDTQKYLLCVNAANIAKDFGHLSQHICGRLVTLMDASDDYGLIALQGPKAVSLLKTLTNEQIPERFFMHHLTISGVETLTARTGYTGEDGCEIFVPSRDAQKLWESLMEHGHKFGLKPCGLAARDSLRLEAGLLLCGQDMDETTTPREAGLMFAVDMKKSDFLGKEALLRQKVHGAPKKLMPFVMQDKGIARHGFKVFDHQAQEIGVVTSGTLPPEKMASIGLAYITSDCAHSGQEILIDIRGRMARAQLGI